VSAAILINIIGILKDNQTIPTFFAKQADFRKWLQKNHKKETELLVGFYKVDSGKPSMTWSQSVDEALCFGWIDGVRKSIDKDSYQIRFTQRKPTSIWSAINIKKVEELTKQGLMQGAGFASFEKRRENKSKIYSYEKDEVELTPNLKRQFKANKKAWEYFQSLAPSYRKVSAHWVMSAKQETTQIKRLNQLISDSAAGTNLWKDNKYKK
jgi:uncharacterized protein YdeI (YjbR/CyaY-like superfamily)